MRLIDLIISFDQSMLERIEKFCHKTHRRIGWTNFTWARLIAVLLALGFYLMLADINWWPAVLFSLFIYCWYLCATYIIEMATRKEMLKKCANPLRHCGAARILSWIGLIIFLTTIAFIPATICLVYMYFISCTPLPPRDSKLKQWFQSLFLTPIPIRDRDG